MGISEKFYRLFDELSHEFQKFRRILFKKNFSRQNIFGNVPGFILLIFPKNFRIFGNFRNLKNFYENLKNNLTEFWGIIHKIIILKKRI